MLKLIFSVVLFFSVMSVPALAEENHDPRFLSFYVVYHSKEGHDYWATSQDGSKCLWLKESEIAGELLKENDNFKAFFDGNGKLLSFQKYTLQ